MILALSTDLAAIAVAIAVIGALVGSAGFAWLVVHRQQSRLAKLAERLSRGEALDARDLDRIRHSASGPASEASARGWPRRGDGDDGPPDRCPEPAGAPRIGSTQSSTAPPATATSSRSSSSTSTTSSASTTPTATSPATQMLHAVAEVLRGQRPRASTSSAATAARSSWPSCPRRTWTPRASLAEKLRRFVAAAQPHPRGRQRRERDAVRPVSPAAPAGTSTWSPSSATPTTPCTAPRPSAATRSSSSTRCEDDGLIKRAAIAAERPGTGGRGRPGGHGRRHGLAHRRAGRTGRLDGQAIVDDRRARRPSSAARSA